MKKNVLRRVLPLNGRPVLYVTDSKKQQQHTKNKQKKHEYDVIDKLIFQLLMYIRVLLEPCVDTLPLFLW